MTPDYDWLQGLGEDFWRQLRGGKTEQAPARERQGSSGQRRSSFRPAPGSEPNNVDANPAGEREQATSQGQGGHRATYRTLCVRLCDGYYWPVSFATRRDRLGQDAKQCEANCPGRARLFMHRNPGGDVDGMVDLDGKPYAKLATAFLYRTQYVADCTCRGQPWEAETLARHRAYAESAKARAQPSGQ
jgi:hypothetical protein